MKEARSEVKSRAVLVNPGNQEGVYQGLAAEWTAIEPPVWCRLIGSYLERRGVRVDIVDQVAEGLTTPEAVRAVAEREPAFVVVPVVGHQPSASTQSMPGATDFCREFKEQSEGEIPLLVTGGHPAALPEKTLRETGADFVATGEGFITAMDLAGFVEAAGPKWRWVNKNGIRGAVYWDHDNLMRSDPAPNVWNLDEVPGGLWDKLPMGKYRAHNWHCMGGKPRAPYASVYTTLGCPFKCSFCMIQAPFAEGDAMRFNGKANSYRMWSPSAVLRELAALANDHGVENVKIADEMYLLNSAHVRAISKRLIRTGLGERLNMWAYARVDTARDPELLDLVRASGVRWLALGIESVSEHVRDGVEKGQYGAEEIWRVCENIRTHGINLIGNFMFGLPDDTMETMEATLKLALEIKPEFANFYCTMAYPGSGLYSQAVEKGWPKLPDAWEGYSQHGYECLPLRNKSLAAAEILKFRDEAFFRFYRDPSYLRHVERKFGMAARAEVERMPVKLKRRLLGD